MSLDNFDRLTQNASSVFCTGHGQENSNGSVTRISYFYTVICHILYSIRFFFCISISVDMTFSTQKSTLRACPNILTSRKLGIVANFGLFPFVVLWGFFAMNFHSVQVGEG